MLTLKTVEDEKITSGTHASFWLEETDSELNFSTLDHHLETDVVVVGGGISGLTTAYCLVKSGKKVVLVEDGHIGSGETGRTTAHLVTALDDRYYELERIYGIENARLIAQSHIAAIDFIEKTTQEENISCHFARVDGFLFLHPTDEIKSLGKELEACQRAGLSVKELSYVPGMIKDVGPCLQFYNQAQFHPIEYLRGLCNAIQKKGGQIFTSTHAKEIDETGIVTDKGFRVKAAHIVVATNAPVQSKTFIHLKNYPVRTYVIGAKIKKGKVPKALWWDTGDRIANSEIPPYHYIRIADLDDQYDLLLCGGEDHPTGLAEAEMLPEENRYDLLETWTRERFEIEDVLYHWSGQVIEPMDSLASIGRNPGFSNNIYLATGDSGNGMTHGTIAGMLLTDLINGKENPWREIYNPSRFKLLTSGKTFFKEFVGRTLNYYKFKTHGQEMTSLENLKKETGEIFVMEGKKVGVYRDIFDHLHVVSAECMHLGCIIKWNNDEKTWDCPCHGSRYTHEGTVINGPSNKNLPYHMENEEEYFKNFKDL